MTDPVASLAGELAVNEGVEVVVRDQRTPAPPMVAGALVGAADELVGLFVETLVATPQTQRTYERACSRFVAWLGPLAGPEDLTSTAVSRYHPVLARGRASSTVRRSARR